MLCALTSLLEQRKSSEEDGFTLHELLVWMLIIGILGSIAIPNVAAARKAALDSEVETTIEATATQAETLVMGNYRTVKLETLSPVADTVNMKPGTILGMTSNGVGVCLTAYHPDSNYTSTSPLIYDSARNGSPLVTSQVQLTGLGACSPEVWGPPITPAYKVAEGGKIVPVTPLQALPNACQKTTAGDGIRPYKFMDTFHTTTTATATTPAKNVTLRGNIELTENCQALKYSFRVLQATEGQTYIIPISTSNETPGALSTGVSSSIVIVGEKTTEGTIATNWSGNSGFTELVINGNFRLEGFERSPVSWKLKSEYQNQTA